MSRQVRECEGVWGRVLRCFESALAESEFDVVKLLVRFAAAVPIRIH